MELRLRFSLLRLMGGRGNGIFDELQSGEGSDID